MRNLILYLFLIASISSCINTNEHLSEDVKQINISTKDIEDHVNLSDFAKRTEIIQLETCRECLIQKISKIDFSEDKIAILDKGMKQILFFDGKGKFLSKINSVGRGPGEYTDVLDFFIDDQNIVNLITWKKVMQYRTNGEFVNSKDLPFSVSHVLHCSDSLIVLRRIWQNYMEGVTEPFEHKIAITDINFEDFKYDYQFDLKSWDVITPEHSIVFSQYKETAYYYELFNDTIYSINEKGVSPYYYFNFGSHKIPDDYYQLKRSELFAKLQPVQKLATSPKDVYLTNRYFYCTYIFNGSLIYFIQDKKTQDLVQAKKVINDFDDLPFVSPISISNNRLVYPILPVDLVDDKNPDKLNVAVNQLKIDINDNPILIFVELKK